MVYRLFCLSLICLLVACGSTPSSEYFLLTSKAAGTSASVGPSLGIGPVTIPDYLRSQAIVVLEGEHHIRKKDFQRWAEPVDAAVARVIGGNLAILLDTQKVTVFPWRRSDAPAFGVSLSITRLLAGNGQAMLSARWQLRQPVAGAAGAQRISDLSRPLADDSAVAIAEAYSDLLLDLSREIAAAIREARSR